VGSGSPRRVSTVTTLRALETPDGETAQADTDIMGVARQASAPATGRFMFQLKAEDHDEG